MEPKVGLALGSGGARGLCHIEFCKALDEMGLKPSIISGTSIGSIVGGFYAAGMSGKALEALVQGLGFVDYTRMLDVNILHPSGLVKGKQVMEFLDKHLPVKRFEELEIPLKVVATDFWLRRQVVFESGPITPAIRASISIPVIFKPVKIDQTVLVDGGTVNPVPFDIIRNECDILIAIDVSGRPFYQDSEKHTLPSMFESVMNSFYIMQTVVLENKLQISRPDVFIRPALKGIQILDFHKDSEIMESVKEDVEAFKSELRARVDAFRRPKKTVKKKWRRIFGG